MIRGAPSAILRPAAGISLQFLGAVDTVTGSQFLGPDVERRRAGRLRHVPGFAGRGSAATASRSFEAGSLDALLLTHAHLDHCGRVPALVRAGYHGPIFATSATPTCPRSCCATPPSCRRRQRPMASQAPGGGGRRWRRAAVGGGRGRGGAGRRRGIAGAHPQGPARRPHHDPGRALRRTRCRPDRPPVPRRALRGDDGGRARHARHLPRRGAHPWLGHHRAAGNGWRRDSTIVFSGDLGRSDTPIVADPTALTHADYVLVESTYGNREHADHDAAVERLAATINEVAGSRGVMLVPSFAIGRTQELVWVLDELLGMSASRTCRSTSTHPWLRAPSRCLPAPPGGLRRGDGRPVLSRGLAAGVPRRAVHQHGRPVEGDPRSAAADHGRASSAC